jgi:hypothetical protein
MCDEIPGIVQQKIAAYAGERTFVRQIARTPQSPVELIIDVHFS